MSDVSKDFDIPKEQNVVETCISEGKQVVQKYMCKKCPEMFFTKNGYQRHLMCNHKIWNVDQYEPEIIEKTIRIYGQDGYEMTYRKVDKIEEAKKVKLVEYSCDKDNDTSGLQNHDAENEKIGGTNDADESNNTDGEEKDITGRTMDISSNVSEAKAKRRRENCTL